MTDFRQTINDQRDMSLSEQQQAGKPIAGDMDEKYKTFLKTIRTLAETGEIDPNNPQTFLKQDVYTSLDEPWQDKIDLALSNIGNLLQMIYKLFVSKETPDDSPQYQTMIDELWQMKQRIEEHHDVFKF